MLFDLIRDLLLFVTVVFGVGSAWLYAKITAAPLERLCLVIATGLIVVYLWSFGVYVAGGSRLWLYALPTLAAALVAVRWHAVLAFFREKEIARALGHWFAVVAWCAGLQALIVGYSGGGWAADLWEHYDRARFFIERWPVDSTVLLYQIPARPPLANIVTGTFLALTEIGFPRQQVFMLLSSSLTVFPALLWVRRFGGLRNQTATLVLLLAASPMFVENVTLPVTKQPTVFFVLAGLAFLHRSLGPTATRGTTTIAWTLIGAGILSHFSAGPYAVAGALAVVAVRRAEFRHPAFWREHVIAAAVSGALLLTWFGWSASTYGWYATLATNTTVADAAGKSAFQQAAVIFRNIIDTLVPHLWRDFDKSELVQASALGGLRDYFFNLYQTNLPLFFGSTGALILPLLVRRTAAAAGRERTFWSVLLPTIIVVGIAVHSSPGPWGLAQICLQPLGVLGLAFLAAHVHALPPLLRGVYAAGVAIDLLLGIVLHFGLQALALDRWADPGKDDLAYALAQGVGSRINMAAKVYLDVRFIGDDARPYAAMIAVFLAVLFAALLLRVMRGQSARTANEREIATQDETGTTPAAAATDRPRIAEEPPPSGLPFHR